MGNKYKESGEFNVSFNIGKIQVTIYPPSCKTSDDENKRQLAKYLYKLLEMDNKSI